MSTVLASAPTAEPVTLNEVKRQRNITGSDDNEELTRLIYAARRYAENYTGRAFITQVWDLFFDSFPQKIEVPFAPLQSVTHVKYTDTDGVQQTLSDTLYTVNTNAEPGYIIPAYNEDWPDTRAVPDAVEVRFIAGYGDAETDVPQDLRNALFLLIGDWAENTEDSIIGASRADVSFSVRTQLDTYRMWRV